MSSTQGILLILMITGSSSHPCAQSFASQHARTNKRNQSCSVKWNKSIAKFQIICIRLKVFYSQWLCSQTCRHKHECWVLSWKGGSVCCSLFTHGCAELSGDNHPKTPNTAQRVCLESSETVEVSCLLVLLYDSWRLLHRRWDFSSESEFLSR